MKVLSIDGRYRIIVQKDKKKTRTAFTIVISLQKGDVSKMQI